MTRAMQVSNVLICGANDVVEHYEKQARKGFRPLNAMQGIGYFQNLGNFLRNCLEIFWIFQEFFFCNIFGIFLEKFLGGILWEEFLHCSSQPSYLNMEGIDLFFKILFQGRKNFNPQKCERKLMALKTPHIQRRRQFYGLYLLLKCAMDHNNFFAIEFIFLT